MTSTLHPPQYQDLITIEEEKTIQETISRKSLPIPAKLNHEIQEISNISNFINSETKTQRSKSCILFYVPLTSRNLTIDSNSSKGEYATRFYFYNSKNYNSASDPFFLLPPPTITIFQSGVKITEIPLTKHPKHDIETEKLSKIMNSAMKHILEFGLRKGINMINHRNSRMASCASSNGDSFDFQKKPSGGSSQVIRDQLTESGIVKKFESMKMDSEEEKNDLNHHINGKEVGKMLMKGIQRGFSFMPSSVNSSKRGSYHVKENQRNFKGVKEKIEGNFQFKKKRKVKKKRGLREIYMSFIEKFLYKGKISEFDFLLFGLYLGLKKCSVGRLGKLKNSKPKEVLRHLIHIQKNGRIEEFLLNYLQKIECEKFLNLLHIIGVENINIIFLENKKKKIFEKLGKVIKKKLTLIAFK